MATGDMLFVIMILVITLILSLGMSCNRASPYHKDNQFKRNYVYEPLANYESMMTYTDYNTGEAHADNAGSIGTNYDDAHVESYHQPDHHYEDHEPHEEKTKVEGFRGLLSSPVNNEKPLDTYSNAEGSLECPSYGYYNSKGPLCLDKNQINLLQTRGGNANGRQHEIGH